jgi:uncharacterized protein (DUF58 family)
LTAVQELLSRDDWRRLERLVLSSRAAANSPQPGRRRGAHRGYSVEFHDYRQYEPGDDPRDIDWTLYGRLDRLFLRLFRAESELTAHLLVDTSASMGTGLPAKLTFAAKVAAAIAYVVASNEERVGLATFGGALTHVIEPQRGRAHAGRILRTLAGVTSAGASDFTRSLQQYANLPDRRGMAIVITDAFSPAGVEQGLAYLAYRGFEVALLHVLADEELAPDVDDVVELSDVEEAGGPLVADVATVAAYRRELQAFTDRLEQFCAARRMLYLRSTSSATFDGFVAHALGGGLWEPR